MTDRRSLGGFEQARGETQTRGTPNIIGVNPQPGPIPIGPAPPHIRQVISGYDSRPIGGYDFVLTGSFLPYFETAYAPVTSPKGYITVVRRIEIEPYPAFLNGSEITWNFTANGVAATAWEWTLPRLLSFAKIDTFFVIPPDTPFGIKSPTTFSGGGAEAGITLYARYIGNLILDSNEPPTEQVGSLPHAVFTLNKEF